MTFAMSCGAPASGPRRRLHRGVIPRCVWLSVRGLRSRPRGAPIRSPQRRGYAPQGACDRRSKRTPTLTTGSETTTAWWPSVAHLSSLSNTSILAHRWRTFRRRARCWSSADKGTHLLPDLPTSWSPIEHNEPCVATHRSTSEVHVNQRRTRLQVRRQTDRDPPGRGLVELIRTPAWGGLVPGVADVWQLDRRRRHRPSVSLGEGQGRRFGPPWLSNPP